MFFPFAGVVEEKKRTEKKKNKKEKDRTKRGAHASEVIPRATPVAVARLHLRVFSFYTFYSASSNPQAICTLHTDKAKANRIFTAQQYGSGARVANAALATVHHYLPDQPFFKCGDHLIRAMRNYFNLPGGAFVYAIHIIYEEEEEEAVAAKEGSSGHYRVEIRQLEPAAEGGGGWRPSSAQVALLEESTFDQLVRTTLNGAADNDTLRKTLGELEFTNSSAIDIMRGQNDISIHRLREHARNKAKAAAAAAERDQRTTKHITDKKETEGSPAPNYKSSKQTQNRTISTSSPSSTAAPSIRISIDTPSTATNVKGGSEEKKQKQKQQQKHAPPPPPAVTTTTSSPTLHSSSSISLPGGVSSEELLDMPLDAIISKSSGIDNSIEGNIEPTYDH